MATNDTGLVLQEKALAVAPKFSSEQIKLLADTIAKGCDENELRLFIEIAKLKRLDPFAGQIRPVKRWNSDLGRNAMVIQVGIDGYRSTAARTNEIAGIDDAIFDSEDEDHPRWAKITVYRWSHGEKIPYTATARWGEYVQNKKDGTPNSMWSRMPFLMLAKCAEALALRKAFPDVLSGMYTEEEMGQADNPEPQGFATGKAPVQQPQRLSEKTAQSASQGHTEPQTTQTSTPPTEIAQAAAQTQSNGLERIQGIIETAKPGKRGTLWMNVANHLIVVNEDKVDDSMLKGNYITIEGRKKVSQKIGDFYEVEKIYENPPEAEAAEVAWKLETEPVEGAVVDAEFEEVAVKPEDTATDFTPENLDAEPPEGGDPGPVPTIDAMKHTGVLTTANNLQTPKTIGLPRAKRLYTIAGINVKTTGFTEDVIKTLLKKLNPPIEHLRELPVEHYALFEKYADGTDTDWKRFI